MLLHSNPSLTLLLWTNLSSTQINDLPICYKSELNIMPVIVNSIQAFHNSNQPYFVFASNSGGSYTLRCY